MTDSNSKTSSSVPPAANPLATEPISHLIRKYSIPTALTLMVNYLYNIADQIFVGQGVGITGMAATNVAFPLTIVTTALALMLGDGCSANLNLSLGRGEQDTADRTISHAVTLLVSTGVLLALFGSIFAPQIVRAFGATDTAFSAALDYTRIIVFGLPFLLFCSPLPGPGKPAVNTIIYFYYTRRRAQMEAGNEKSFPFCGLFRVFFQKSVAVPCKKCYNILNQSHPEFRKKAGRSTHDTGAMLCADGRRLCGCPETFLRSRYDLPLREAVPL